MPASHGTLVQFPFSPRPFVSRVIERCPALAAVYARLPHTDDGPLWHEYELIFCAAVGRLTRLPSLPAADAFILLDSMAATDDLLIEEICLFDRDPERRDLSEYCNDICDAVAMPRDIYRCGLLVAALLGRLLRFESRV